MFFLFPKLVNGPTESPLDFRGFKASALEGLNTMKHLSKQFFYFVTQSGEN